MNRPGKNGFKSPARKAQEKAEKKVRGMTSIPKASLQSL
jgi:hypothetical protein